MRTLASIGGILALVSLGMVSAPTPVAAADADIRVNEVQSDDPDGGQDWVELTNIGSEPVDVSDWLVKDNNDDRTLRLPAGTEIAPGAFFSFEPDAGENGFGLGSDDSVRVYAADGTTLIDEVEWTDHASTEGLLPDGTGEWSDLRPTRDAPNEAREATSDVVLNEVESGGDARGDWVELANVNTEQTADVSGWTIADNNPENTPMTLPEGTEIESGGYLGVVIEGFGLGNPDSVTVRDASGSVVDSYEWADHAPATYGRCPDMTGEFAETGEGSFALPNVCEETPEPPVDADPWPFNNTVRDAVAPDTWGEDMSGLDFSSDGTLYAVNNDNAEIFRLAEADSGMFSIDESWVPRYPDGTGQPDAEGLTVAGDDSIFLATERDNSVNDVSRPSVLKVATDGADVTTTAEWNLAEQLGTLGANAGLEGIEWISDADATRLGLLDDGQPYDPANYEAHSGGIFAISVEQTGEVILAVLEDGGGVTVLQTATLGPAVDVAMSLDWRAGGNELWAQCDEACDNRASRLTVQDGTLTWERDFLAPTGMPTAYTNEGLAMRWCAAAPDVDPTVAWISDTAHEGVSLRVADGGDCSATPPPPSEEPRPSEDPSADPSPAPRESDDPVGGGTGDDERPGTLPRTGVSNAGWALGVGAVLLLAGGSLLALSRRRSMR